MTDEKPSKVRIRFPGDLEYIPAIRKFVSEMLQVNHFSPKFAFRSEIIIDEICNNAVTYGCKGVDASVEVACLIYGDRIEFQVKDTGGSKDDLKRLKTAVDAQQQEAEQNVGVAKQSLGLEIVRMLSEEVNLEVDDNNLTSIRVVRRREDAAAQENKKSK